MPNLRPIPRLLLPVALAAVSAVASAQGEVYKSRDAEGNVIFSDKASANAEPVKLPRTNTMPEAAPQAPATPKTGTQATPAASGYSTLAIVAPTEGEQLFSAVGEMEVHVSVMPPLLPDHSLRLLLNGAPAGIPQQGVLRLEGLARGSYTLELQVVDANGDTVQSSGTRTVHLQRTVTRPKGLPARP